MKNSERVIKEILTKECERYSLFSLGFLSREDFVSTVSAFACKYGDPDQNNFAKWKSDSLRDFYRERGFSRFCREHTDDPRFEKLVFQLMRNILRERWEKTQRSETDKYLAPENDSISFALSPEHFTEIYSVNINPFITFGHPLEIELWCKELISKYFPLEESHIITELEKDKNFFWGKFYLKLKAITAAFCYQMSKVSGEENTHDIWSDTCLTINEAVTTKRIVSPATAKSILSYAVGIIKNKNRELQRNRKGAPVEIDPLQYRLTQEDESNFFDNPALFGENFTSQTFQISNYIDISDAEARERYLIVILYNEKHPLHSELTKGLEEKIDKLFLHYLKGLSYEEIAVKYSGKMERREVLKEAARIRQEIKRTKETLLKRYIQMINKETIHTKP